MKLLIVGDSFAADWTKKYPTANGWPNMLANIYQVTNIAQAGCGEYKILKQLQSQPLDKFNAIIVCHTSPYRIYTKEHPVHTGDALHNGSDLIYTDIKEHSLTNPTLLPLVDYFENYFDLDYAKDVHNMICCSIDKEVTNFRGTVIHVTNFEWVGLYKFKDMLDFTYLLKKHRGDINHYDIHGNEVIYDKLLEKL